MDFELGEGNAKRALVLYERQMSQSIEKMNDIHLWKKYIDAIQSELKDSNLVRA